MRRALWLLALALLGAAANAEGADPAPSSLQPITVTSHRIPEDLVEVPAAVGAVSQTDIQLGRQQLALDEALVRIPGVFLQNRYNFAQDLRISSRGFGARSSFGIRGLKVLVDGIPATLPDGQTEVDSIDIGSLHRIEVLRGPASSLYGPAAGGVISMVSQDGPEQPFIEGHLAFGEFGFEQYRLKAGGTAKPFNYFLALSHTRLDGYRAQSRMRSSLLTAKLRYGIDETSDLSVILTAVDSPRAEDPGGLTWKEARADPTQASPKNLLYDARELLDQQKLGLVYRKSFGPKHQIAARNYYIWRDFGRFPAPPTSSIDLRRFFVGGGAGYTYTDQIFGHRNRLTVGFDADAQRDQRKRFHNDEGSRGRPVFDQDEDVSAYGVYVQDRVDLGWNLELSAGARYDRVEFRVSDHFTWNGDESGRIDFHELSPAVGLLWSPLPGCNLYGSISTSFETPTTTELANPSGAGGFNPELSAQTATNYEIGVKGLLPGRLRYGVALFRVESEGELVPFELEETDRIFYRNAGRSTRRGVEFDLAVEAMRGLTVSLAYTYSDFRFDRYETPDGVFDGNRIPGIPRNQLYAELHYRHPSGFYAVWDGLYVSSLYVDDANRVRSGPYFASSLRIGHRLRIDRVEIAPFVGLNNLFDEAYNDNVRINAAHDRYFEPAPDRNLYGGVTVRYSFGG